MLNARMPLPLALIFVHAPAYLCSYTHACMHLPLCVHVHTRVHALTLMRAFTHTHACMHLHLCVHAEESELKEVEWLYSLEVPAEGPEKNQNLTAEIKGNRVTLVCVCLFLVLSLCVCF